MTFEEKKELVDAARAGSIEMDEQFKELLGSGLSTLGAYNICYEKLTAKAPATAPEVKKPVPTSKKPTNATTKVEKANEQPSKLK